jgi:hypothetical protein
VVFIDLSFLSPQIQSLFGDLLGGTPGRCRFTERVGYDEQFGVRHMAGEGSGSVGADAAGPVGPNRTDRCT